jgi:hypothetical protein
MRARPAAEGLVSSRLVSTPQNLKSSYKRATPAKARYVYAKLAAPAAAAQPARRQRASARGRGGASAGDEPTGPAAMRRAAFDGDEAALAAALAAGAGADAADRGGWTALMCAVLTRPRQCSDLTPIFI